MVARRKSDGTAPGSARSPGAKAPGRKVLFSAMKNEAPFVLEWIAYHKVIGFTDIDPNADTYHRYVQWIVHEQLPELPSRLERR